MKSLKVLGFQKVGVMTKEVVLSAMLGMMELRMPETYFCIVHYLLGITSLRNITNI